MHIIYNGCTERGHARTNEKMGMFVKYFDGAEGIEEQLRGERTISTVLDYYYLLTFDYYYFYHMHLFAIAFIIVIYYYYYQYYYYHYYS